MDFKAVPLFQKSLERGIVWRGFTIRRTGPHRSRPAFLDVTKFRVASPSTKLSDRGEHDNPEQIQSIEALEAKCRAFEPPG